MNRVKENQRARPRFRYYNCSRCQTDNSVKVDTGPELRRVRHYENCSKCSALYNVELEALPDGRAGRLVSMRRVPS